MLAAFLLGGIPGAGLGVVVGAFWLLLKWPARQWFWVAAAVMTTVPVLWLLGNYSRKGEVTPDLVSQNLWPHYATLLVLLCVGVGAVSARPADDQVAPEEAP